MKGNVIERLEFELANYDSAVQRFIHYTTSKNLDFRSEKNGKTVRVYLTCNIVGI